MALSSGTRIGPYEIVDAIGAGGMGEVYRATDTKLDREVAIKTLPSALATDTDRLARFEREAKLLAALNHPNIAVIYGLEESDGTQCIAMELIEGETLEEKLKDGPLPVEDALRLALQITQALEAAHDKGVVHRDLKPANVMVTGEGIVKVLDFGLAKAFFDDSEQSTLGQSPALSLAMTQAGIVLGTASYMSPEQASGQATDQRADVWAFGVVLFEMLSGLPLFTGESVPHILADVLRAEPDWNRLPRNLHPRLKFLLERCLEKKARNRYHGIADARVDIEVVLSDPEGGEATNEAREVISSRPKLSWVATTAVLTAVITGLLAWIIQPTPAPPPINRFDYALPDGQQLRSNFRPVMALSPNGRHFVYNTVDGLYLRAMDELEARLIPGTEPTVFFPAFSPDGREVAYREQGAQQIKRIAISGGAPVVIADALQGVDGLSWAADGTILFGQDEGIYRVPATGGTPELIIPSPTDEGSTQPYDARLLPDGDSVLFSLGRPDDFDMHQILVQSLSTGERTVLIEGGSDPRYIPTGHLAYMLGDGLFAVRFDLDNLTVLGGAVPLVQGVMRAVGDGAANYGVSENGTLVYLTGSAFTDLVALAWVDRQGREEYLAAEPRDLASIRLSPDGRRMVSGVFEDNNDDIWIYDLERNTSSRLTFDPAEDDRPVWAPDGGRIVFGSDRADEYGMYWKASDGTGQVERLTTGVEEQFPESFSPDGMRLIYREQASGITSDLHILSLDGEISSQPLLVTEFDEDQSAISPDGNWVAYVSNETGNRETYVRPFPNFDDGKWQISTGGGVEPVWGPDGSELFFLVLGRPVSTLMVVDVETTPAFSAGSPRELFQGEYQANNAWFPNYAVSPDGERFLMLKQATPSDGESGRPKFVIVENWFEELDRLAPPVE